MRSRGGFELLGACCLHGPWAKSSLWPGLLPSPPRPTAHYKRDNVPVNAPLSVAGGGLRSPYRTANAGYDSTGGALVRSTGTSTASPAVSTVPA